MTEPEPEPARYYEEVWLGSIPSGTSKAALSAALAKARGLLVPCSYEIKKMNHKAARRPDGERIGYAILRLHQEEAVAAVLALDGCVLRLPPSGAEFVARVRVASTPSSQLSDAATVTSIATSNDGMGHETLRSKLDPPVEEQLAPVLGPELTRRLRAWMLAQPALLTHTLGLPRSSLDIHQHCFGLSVAQLRETLCRVYQARPRELRRSEGYPIPDNICACALRALTSLEWCAKLALISCSPYPLLRSYFENLRSMLLPGANHNGRGYLQTAMLSSDRTTKTAAEDSVCLRSAVRC